MAVTFAGCANSSRRARRRPLAVRRRRAADRARRPPRFASSSSGRARSWPAAGEVEIEVAAAGLNFRDVMKALGIYPLGPDEPVIFGDEFSGRIIGVGRGVRRLRAGDRVMGFAPEGGAFASHLVVRTDAVWRVPAALGLAEAASIPVVFGTAYHALCSLARLRRGETVLVHAAAGGVGLAALQLARQIGAVVFATAGSEEKRDLLRSLGAAHVMDSRTLDFADEVLQHTDGRGVDVVLNSLAGAFQHKSLAVCAPHGRFVEIGKRDLFENRALPVRRSSDRSRSSRSISPPCSLRVGLTRVHSGDFWAAGSRVEALRRSRTRRSRPVTRCRPFAGCRPRSTPARSCSSSSPIELPTHLRNSGRGPMPRIW